MMSFKRVSLAVLTVGLVGSLAACGGGGSQSEQSASSGSKGSSSASSLDLWMPPLSADSSIGDKEGWETILEPFEAEHGVSINVTIVPWASYEEKYLTGIASGQGPDVGYMYSEMIGDYINRDQLIPFDDYLTDEQKANYIYLENGQFNGKQYSIPIVVGAARVLYYNQDILDSAGVAEPPATWDDFLDVCQQVKDSGQDCIVAPWGDPARGVLNSIFFPFVWQSDGDLFTEDGSDTLFNSDAFKEAANFVVSLKDNGYMPDSATGLADDEAQQVFASGNSAFYIDSTSQLGILNNDGALNVGFVPSLENKQTGTFIASDSMVLLKDCADPQLCADLAAYMTSAESMEQFQVWSPYPPITEDAKYMDDPIFEELYTSGDSSMFRTLPPVANSTAAYNVLYSELQQMMMGQKTVDQALSDAATAGKAALAGDAS